MEIFLKDTGIRKIGKDAYYSLCENYLITDIKFKDIQERIIAQYKLLRQSPSMKDIEIYKNLYNELVECYSILEKKEHKNLPPLQKGVVWMTTKEYLERVSYDIYGCTLLETIAECDNAQISNFAKDMKHGDTFPPIYLDYTNRKQDGRHRSLAYYINGYKEIPVTIY